MNICKIASESSCGKSICCMDCADKDTCREVCEYLADALTCDMRMEVAEPEETGLAKLEEYVPQELVQMQDLLLAKQSLEAKEKELKEKIKQAMEQNGIDKWENPLFSVTYVKPTTRNTIDSTKLKKDLPEIAEKYTKTSKVSGSIRVKIK